MEKNKNKWAENFECISNEMEGKEYISKFTQEGECQGKTFKYRYYIIAENIEEGKWLYALRLVVLPESMCKKVIDGIMSTCGLTDKEDISFYDIVSNGGADVLFDSDISDEFDEDKVNGLANLIHTKDTLMGWYMDKTWNRMGSTGWDIIAHAIKGQDLLLPAINRMRLTA